MTALSHVAFSGETPPEIWSPVPRQGGCKGKAPSTTPVTLVSGCLNAVAWGALTVFFLSWSAGFAAEAANPELSAALV